MGLCSESEDRASEYEGRDILNGPRRSGTPARTMFRDKGQGPFCDHGNMHSDHPPCLARRCPGLSQITGWRAFAVKDVRGELARASPDERSHQAAASRLSARSPWLKERSRKGTLRPIPFLEVFGTTSGLER